jgi:VanZ family protein
VWTGVIFYLSGGGGSLNETSRFIRPLLEFLFPGASAETLSIYHGAIRKFAHVFEYAVLAALTFRAFQQIDALRERSVLWVMAFVVLVASVDEINQSFDARRTGTINDVLLDTVGGVFGLVIYWIFRRARRKPASGNLVSPQH